MTAARTENGGSFRIRVSVSPGAARTKLVALPVVPDPVRMGVRGDVAAHYRVEDGTYEEQATTLDYFVGAVVACLTGTFAGMLGSLGEKPGQGGLTADGEGVIENDGGVLRVRGIHVTYQLRLSPGTDVVKVRRAHERHRELCPLALSVGGCIDITTELRLSDEDSQRC